ncbi:MAG: hypothetical protein OXB88_03165 [Bacteriovoracales bacterium]|nr:hypothetical protein [Bacteriovoracales bacterium]
MKSPEMTSKNRLNFRQSVSKKDILAAIILLFLAFRQNAAPLLSKGLSRDAKLRLYERAQYPGPSQKTLPPLVRLAYSNDDMDFMGPRQNAFYIPSDHQVIAPMKSESTFHNFFIEDDEGALNKIKVTVNQWHRDQLFMERWKLEASNIHAPPTLEERRRFLEKNLIHYVDRRISGEMKKSKKGSTLHKVGSLRNALKPQTKFRFGKNYRLRFRPKVLKGLINMKFENPYIDESLLKIKVFNRADFWNRESRGGEMKLHLGHRFNKTGPYSSHIEYGLSGENWKWEVRRELKEIMPNLALRFQSIRENRPTFGHVSDKISEVIYRIDF